jgi:thymidylate synthase
MAIFIQGRNVSVAWLQGLAALLEVDGEAVNLAVAIDDPTTELPTIRAEVDAFIDERRPTKKGLHRISTVANTIFPQSLYVERLGVGAEAHLYKMERRSRPITRRRNSRGNYFERMVAWPGSDGQTFNQLDQAITRLRRLREQGHQRGNQFEVGLATPADEATAVPIAVPGRDRQTIGFPCLSHVSLSLQKGVVHMSALYRNHEFLDRAYGNYVGLGRLLRFVAHQSGWPLGELTCVSASVTLGKFSKRSLNDLLAACQSAAAA